MKKITFLIVTIFLFILSGCSPKTAEPAVMEKTPMTAGTEEKPVLEMEKPTEVMEVKTPATPAWMTTELTDVRTGEVFKISDFHGKVVLLETLAMWCPTCIKQQMQIQALHEALGMNEDLISIGLDIDHNEEPGDLKAYVENYGFDWYYAVAPKGVGGGIGQLYGANFLNPPLSPILVIDRNGEGHPMPHGLKTMEDLKTFVEPFLAEDL